MSLAPNEALALAELEWELSAPHTLEAIAEHLGVTQRTVEKTQARALRKLRILLDEQNLGDWQEGGLREPPLLSQRRANDHGGELPSTGLTPRRPVCP